MVALGPYLVALGILVVIAVINGIVKSIAETKMGKFGLETLEPLTLKPVSEYRVRRCALQLVWCP